MTFTTTKKRGIELLEHVYAEIVAIEASKRVETGQPEWDQDVWWNTYDTDMLADLIANKATGVEIIGPGSAAIKPEVMIKECETACCFAGYTALVAGDRPKVNFYRDVDGDIYIDVEDYGQVVDRKGNVSSTRLRAMDLLDISGEQAEVLFDGSNTLEDLGRIIEQIKAGVDGRAIESWYDEIKKRRAFPEVTASRGIALLREVMDQIEFENAADRLGNADSRPVDWDQGNWGTFRGLGIKDVILTKAAAGKLEKLGRRTHATDAWRTRPADIVVDRDTVLDCGTACCFAGTTALMVGDSPIMVNAGPMVSSNWNNVLTLDDQVKTVEERATELLDIDLESAAVLFHGSNTIHDLREMVAALEDGEVLRTCDGCDEWTSRCECGEDDD